MKFPKVGMRIIKSVVAVYLCFIIDYFLRDGMPFYAAIAAIICTQKDVKNSIEAGKTRVFGTIAGGLMGMVVLVGFKALGFSSTSFFYYTSVALLLIPVMYVTVVSHHTGSTYITTVVFLSIVVSHFEDINPYSFATTRILDTLIGIACGCFINWLPLFNLFTANKEGTRSDECK